VFLSWSLIWKRRSFASSILNNNEQKKRVKIFSQCSYSVQCQKPQSRSVRVAFKRCCSVACKLKIASLFYLKNIGCDLNLVHYLQPGQLLCGRLRLRHCEHDTGTSPRVILTGSEFLVFRPLCLFHSANRTWSKVNQSESKFCLRFSRNKRCFSTIIKIIIKRHDSLSKSKRNSLKELAQHLSTASTFVVLHAISISSF